MYQRVLIVHCSIGRIKCYSQVLVLLVHAYACYKFSASYRPYRIAQLHVQGLGPYTKEGSARDNHCKV